MPHSKFRFIWNYIKSMFFLFILLTIPFRFFFNEIDRTGFIVIDIMIDIFFFFDVILQFFFAYQIKIKIFKTPKLVAFYYLKFSFKMILIFILDFGLFSM